MRKNRGLIEQVGDRFENGGGNHSLAAKAIYWALMGLIVGLDKLIGGVAFITRPIRRSRPAPNQGNDAPSQ